MTGSRKRHARGLLAKLVGLGITLSLVVLGGRSSGSSGCSVGTFASWLGSGDAARQACEGNLRMVIEALEMKAVDHGSFPQPFFLQEAPGDAMAHSGSFRNVPPADLRAESYLEDAHTRCPNQGTYAAMTHRTGPIATCSHHGLLVSQRGLEPFSPRSGGLHADGRTLWIGSRAVLLEEAGRLYSFMGSHAAYLEGPEAPCDRLVVKVETVEGQRCLVFTRRSSRRGAPPDVDVVPLSTFPAPDAVERVLEHHLTKLAR